MIDLRLLLLLTTSQIVVCFWIVVLPSEYPLANLIYDFDICFFWELELLLAISVRLIWFWCVYSMIGERSLSGFGALCLVLKGRFFSRTWGKEGRYYE